MKRDPLSMYGARRVRLWAALLFVALLAAYGNSFENAFHFDDVHTITDNPAVRSLRNVPRFFTDASAFSVLPANRTYRPVVSVSLAMDYALGGGYYPAAFHVGTFCWFVCLLLLLFLLYQQVMDGTEASPENRWLALIGAAWFGLHPAMAETVNYIIQRGDLYCTLGCVAALVGYARWPCAAAVWVVSAAAGACVAIEAADRGLPCIAVLLRFLL